jgi:hypothetical protein
MRMASGLSVLRSYKKDKWGNQVSFAWESMKKRGSWKGAAVQRELGRLKLKNLHC